MINIYCDGGCSGNQSDTNIGGWGAVLEYKGTVKELKGGELNTTNNRMEMTALIEALKSIKNTDMNVSVYSDSAYIINCFHQKWYVNWQRNGWKNSKKAPVENKDLWEEMLLLVERHPKVNFFKVKGHIDIDDTASIKKWHAKFKKDYGFDMPIEAYTQGIIYNNRADELANEAMDELR
ncbi:MULTISPECIES: ribonuclease H [unclassified Fusibacter]|uniref:ribonuclease H family protein n=1 Tax=unclassified Fusibacter TaxID=2624464 RepID=UPI001FA9E020|nr:MULTISPECIES: ribonuclease H [unclassified Fusibacter]MCK8059265.1 ribonuclease HI [Fusibacter sp. A2]